MYRVTAITGQRSTVTNHLTSNTSITGLVAGGGHQNLIYLQATDFISGPAVALFDTYGMAYAAGGKTYTVSNPSLTQIREVDNTANSEVGYVGNSTLCMAGLVCPLVYPLQLCLSYSAVDTTGAYGRLAYGTVTSSLLATATVQSSGLVTSLQGTRTVTADVTGSGAPVSFVQLVTLLPPGSVNGSSNLLTTQAPYLDSLGLTWYTTPPTFSLSNGINVLSLVSPSSPNITEDGISAMVAASLVVSAGPCSNLASVSWFYPSPTPVPVSLSYSFAYPLTTATTNGIVVQTTLTLHIDASHSIMPPDTSPLSQGFLVLDISGTRTISHYSASVLSKSRVDQVTSVLPADGYDGFGNSNLLFLLSADQSAFGLGFNTTSSDGTGTAGGVGGAVALRWNVSQQLYQEMASNALGSVMVTINQMGSHLAPAGLSAACLTGSFIDTAGLYNYTHISYSLTLLYSPMLSGTDSNGQWFTIVDVHGTRTSHGVVSSSTTYLNLLPTVALNNDNLLYPSLSAGPLLHQRRLRLHYRPRHSRYLGLPRPRPRLQPHNRSLHRGLQHRHHRSQWSTRPHPRCHLPQLPQRHLGLLPTIPPHDSPVQHTGGHRHHHLHREWDADCRCQPPRPLPLRLPWLPHHLSLR